MTPGFIDIVYSESSRHVRPRHREKHELHLVLFTLRPSRQFSSTPELINEPLNEREEGEKKKKLHISQHHFSSIMVQEMKEEGIQKLTVLFTMSRAKRQE